MNKQFEGILNIQGAAEYMKVSKSTIRNFVNNGVNVDGMIIKLQHTRYGGNMLMFKKEWLDRFAEVTSSRNFVI